MKKYLYTFLLTLVATFSFSQVVINELDSDTPGIDDKEFVELKSTTPFFSLDGYVLVFFNGNPTASNANRSYLTINLSGLVTDANGLVVIGSALVAPVPQRIIADNLIQNGEDAVAIYLGTPDDFPDFTLATTTNLIDVLIYDTSDPQAIGLMDLFNVFVQTNENQFGQAANHSIQRKNDGTYEVKIPTPGANNDGSGIQFNGITITVDTSHKNEGDSFDITFTTQNPTLSDLNFSFLLNNGGFNAADFSGNLNVFIPQGGTTFTSTIQIIDDELDEGDEEMRIRFGVIPDGYVRMNDNIYIRVIDNDFSVSPWGTPLNPTYGVVTSTAPAGYYDSLNGKAGAVLTQALQDIIANPNVVRAHNYGDITDILKLADQNPANNNQVWLMYVEQPRAKLDFQTTGSSTGKWNREHIYPQSRGGFSNGTSDTADGIDIWLPTDANDILAGHADAHHIRAEDGPENSSRNNRDYGLNDYNGPTGNLGSWKGDVARAVFYMAVRYNVLNVVNGNPPDNTLYELGDLATLLTWNQTDPSDDFEMNRNNYIYTWQYNRNPFIDLPQLADYIWGANAGQVWQGNLSVENPTYLDFNLYPNPSSGTMTLAGVEGSYTYEVITIDGQRVAAATANGVTTLTLDVASGMYFIKVTSNDKTSSKKIIIK
ncbi:endonuclease [Flavobacterium orientale]|uniref:Ribonuclease n=1 Tax=Flavobacterium orientale TaxID=1756020 RepID=A0A916Y1R0_9FLAO|nr:endonuclease [Flavobacterium orientale]GGD26547.1 ribonuclease [Flavobacterium orientale]